MQYPNPTQPTRARRPPGNSSICRFTYLQYSTPCNTSSPTSLLCKLCIIFYHFSLQKLSTEKLSTTYLSTHRTIQAEQFACRTCRKDRITPPTTAMPPLQTSEDLLICCACGTQFDISANQPLQACRICDVSC